MTLPWVTDFVRELQYSHRRRELWATVTQLQQTGFILRRVLVGTNIAFSIFPEARTYFWLLIRLIISDQMSGAYLKKPCRYNILLLLDLQIKSSKQSCSGSGYRILSERLNKIATQIFCIQH